MFRRIKRLLRLRNKSGFTLVEVIIACALLGLLVLGVMGFATPVLSSVRAKEQNARATMLSESVCTYIANTIEYAYGVMVIENVASDNTASAAFNSAYGEDFEANYNDGLGLADLIKNYENNFSKENYEIRCIGIRWLDAPGEGRKKLMITNEKVDSATGALDASASQLVFDPVFYEGLYPVITYNNYSNQPLNPEYEKNPAGNSKYISGKDEKSGILYPEELGIAPGFMITADVYTSPDCYNTKDSVREGALLTFSGVTYGLLANIKQSMLIYSVPYDLYPKIKANNASYTDAYNADPTANKTFIENGETYYYPNTFIYYIAKKARHLSEG